MAAGHFVCGTRASRFLRTHVPTELTRIFSDMHYGDRLSRVDRLAQIRPLLDGVTDLVLNGDTVDTRAGPNPQHTAACRAHVQAFVRDNAGLPITFLTGNHDPDFSAHHLLERAGGRVLVTHGDILFDNIVPWGRDARTMAQRIAAAYRDAAPADRDTLDTRFAIWRRVAASIPQRHQSERDALKYAVHLAADTVWPPWRFLRVIHAWRSAPALAAGFARRHHPRAQFTLIGHTHRPGVHRMPDGAVVINTGSFCPPLGGYAVDLSPGQLAVRRIDFVRGEFRAGENVATFPLAGT
jgi:predicted phosphodiesterase